MASQKNTGAASSLAGGSTKGDSSRGGGGTQGLGVGTKSSAVSGQSNVTESMVSDPEAQREMLSKKYRWNWRLNQLSEPAPRLRGKKYEKPPDVIMTNVSPAALKATSTMRTDHLARPALRFIF